MTTPNDIQHGGDHYKKAGDKQHWDMLPALGFGWEYYVGRATAYLTRIKDQKLDPHKADHFVVKLLWLIDHGHVPDVFQTCKGTRNSDGGTVPHSWRVDVEDYLRTYYEANNIDPKSNEASAILFLMIARTRDDLLAARAAIGRIIANKTPVKPAEPTVTAAVAAQVQTPVGDTVQATGDAQGTAEVPGSGYVNQDQPPPSTPKPRRARH